MDRMSPSFLHPARLSPGTQVGPWRVEAWAGRGVYGAVYKARSVKDTLAAPVALKVALFPDDPRFAREVELLSRAHHPSLPELYGHGTWEATGGTLHPYLAMQWVNGLSLYDWARMQAPSPTEVLGLLAQLASALHALHSLGCIHRDVKGGNVLVRHSDGRAFLMDLGSGLYPDAETLTPPTMYPGTPAYRAPESWLFELQSHRKPSAPYRAGPADDLYALGVTACRVLTGEYPEPGAPAKDEHGTWQLGTVLIPPALRNMAGTEPRLHALVMRMLSVRPEERGTAEDLAQALEQASKPIAAKSHQLPATEAPLPAPPPPNDAGEAHAATPQSAAASLPVQGLPAAKPSSLTGDSAGLAAPQAPARPVWPRLALAASLALAVSAWWMAPRSSSEEPTVARANVTRVNPPGTDTAGLGEEAAAASMEQAPHSPPQEVMAEDAPPEPQPGQIRPDAEGRCPRKEQTPINRGCWLELSLDSEACKGNGGRIFKKKCYLPVPPIPLERPPTSSPPEKR
jgi:eukaryotic-like serine/threonine-protein kinase